MITAQEAKNLEVEQFLKTEVEKKVMDAAKNGEHFTFIYLGDVGPFETIEQKLTPLNRAVVEQLVKLGYHATFTLNGHTYVPWGLADDDGNGPMHRNYGIQLGW